MRVLVCGDRNWKRLDIIERELRKLDVNVQIISIAAPRLVPLIEAGKIDDEETREAVKSYCINMS